MSTGYRTALLCLAVTFLMGGLAQAQAPQPANPTPAATPATAPAPAQTPPANASAPAVADTPQVQKDREWLVAYLIAHQGYRIDQMDMLEKRIAQMTPTQVETLVDVYKQKHDLALQREANYQRFQQQQLSLYQQDQAQRNQEQEDYTQQLNDAANQEQSRINTQLKQSGTPQQFPYLPYGTGYGYGYPAYGAFYDRYWH
ncbi:MAG: hypothetical protein KF708_21490 [Pirellulales bacterium]|nr:hypothetical protein [Pirellulales bacterium]